MCLLKIIKLNIFFGVDGLTQLDFLITGLNLGGHLFTFFCLQAAVKVNIYLTTILKYDVQHLPTIGMRGYIHKP